MKLSEAINKSQEFINYLNELNNDSPICTQDDIKAVQFLINECKKKLK